MQRSVVVISRHWHNPAIEVGVSSDGIQIDMAVEDFCRALVAEIPHPVMCFTRTGLADNIVAAMDVVLEKAKQASIHNPPAPAAQPE
jgi:hypothetical protein